MEQALEQIRIAINDNGFRFYLINFHIRWTLNDFHVAKLK